MSSVLADTHIVIWVVMNSPRLSLKAKEAVQQTVKSGSPVLVSAVSVAEIIYATEKRRLPETVLAVILNAAHREQFGLKIVPFDLEMAESMRRVPREIVPDLPDRMIAGCALALGVPLITADEKIHRSGITVIW